MAGRIEGKVAAVTGARAGMGAAIVERFCREGARVVATRVGQPREIADLALFLASDEAAFITGTEIYIDGGYTAL